MYILAYKDLDALKSMLQSAILIIGVLQLVKKIPEVINAIFGTHIKDRGGIKGRLGEMAGIGGLAQQAWASIGNLGKNLGKLYFTLPFAGGAVAANVGYHAKTKKWLKDNPIFQQAKGIGYGVRGALKSGSWMTGYQEYEKGSEPPQHTRNELMEYRKRVTDQLAQGGAGNRDGSWDNYDREKDGTIKYKKDEASGQMVAQNKSRAQILDEISNARQVAESKIFNGKTKLGKEMIDQTAITAEAKIKYNDLLSVQKAGEGATKFAFDVTNDILEHKALYSASDVEKAKEIQSRLSTNDVLISEADGKFLKRFMDVQTAQNFETAVKRYDDALETTLDKHSEYTAAELTGVGRLAGAITNAKDEVDASVANEQAISSKMSDIDQMGYQTYSSIIEKQTSALSTANKFTGNKAPEDKVLDSNGKQYHGWANNSAWRTNAAGEYDGGTDIKSSEDSSPTGQTRQYSSQTEPGLFESSGANAPIRRSSSGASHFWDANRGKYGQAEDREKRMKSAEAGDEWEDYGRTIDD